MMPFIPGQDPNMGPSQMGPAPMDPQRQAMVNALRGQNAAAGQGSSIPVAPNPMNPMQGRMMGGSMRPEWMQRGGGMMGGAMRPDMFSKGMQTGGGGPLMQGGVMQPGNLNAPQMGGAMAPGNMMSGQIAQAKMAPMGPTGVQPQMGSMPSGMAMSAPGNMNWGMPPAQVNQAPGQMGGQDSNAVGRPTPNFTTGQLTPGMTGGRVPMA